MANRTTLLAQLQALITDNTSKQNSATKVRQILTAIINSALNTTDDASTFISPSLYEYTALTTPTGATPTVTIDCASKAVVSRNLEITDDSTGNVTLALSNATNGTTLTLVVTNSDVIDRSIIIPAAAAHIDFSGNSKTALIPTLKRAVFGVTYNGSLYCWTVVIE